MTAKTKTAADKAKATVAKAPKTAAPPAAIDHALVKTVGGVKQDDLPRDEDGNVIVQPPADPREFARQALAAAKGEGTELAESVEGDGETITLESVQLLIVRDAMQKIPVTVFTYELPVLFTLHGQDAIEINEGSFREQDVEDFNPERVYDQLLRKYGNEGANAVRSVYSSVRELAREVGIDLKKIKRRGANYKPTSAGSLAIDHSLAAPKVEKAVAAPKA